MKNAAGRWEENKVTCVTLCVSALLFFQGETPRVPPIIIIYNYGWQIGTKSIALTLLFLHMDLCVCVYTS